MKSELSRPETSSLQPEPAGDTQLASGPTSEQLAEARKHFETALERYSRGQYRGAITELELARELDPHGKDLVYNLALVHEKLGELSTALSYFRLYLQMEDDENERARTEASIVRLEGALNEVAGAPGAPAAHLTQGPSYPVVAHLAPGKLDGWVWITGGVAVAATIVGGLLGVKALATRPGEGEATGGSRSARDFRRDAHRARSYAVAADVLFGTAALAGGSAALLYFGRSADPGPQVGMVDEVEPSFLVTGGLHF